MPPTRVTETPGQLKKQDVPANPAYLSENNSNPPHGKPIYKPFSSHFRCVLAHFPAGKSQLNPSRDTKTHSRIDSRKTLVRPLTFQRKPAFCRCLMFDIRVQSRYCHELPSVPGFGPKRGSAWASPYSIFVSDPGLYSRFSGPHLRPAAMIASVLRGLALAALCAVGITALQAQQQPIAYSHKKHIALGLACLDCHSMADIGPAATIPSVRKCMLCHSTLATDKPEVKKIADYAAKGREIPWQRVYGFETQALVKFNHAPHIRAKVECATCHGDMTQADTAQKLVNHNMGTCITCHRQKGASQDCATCHY